MSELITAPKVFKIAETSINDEGMGNYLKHLEVEGWENGAITDAEELVEVAGKTCYLSFSLDLNSNLTAVNSRSNLDYIQKGLIATGHGSVLEHATVTFALCDVSRILTHELVRHRAGCAYSQVSGRYVRSDRIKFSAPSEIVKDEFALSVFQRMFDSMEQAAKELAEYFGLDTDMNFARKKRLTSAIRRIVGNGQTSIIVMTANHRALRHMLVERTSMHAEEEIRLLFNFVFSDLKKSYPAIYADMVQGPTDQFGLFEVTTKCRKV